MVIAANSGNVHFILTNSSSYISAEVAAGASCILTLPNKRAGRVYTVFGSVIFTRANRDDIGNLSDLKGKSFMAVAPKSFGGWQVPLFELQQHGARLFGTPVW